MFYHASFVGIGVVCAASYFLLGRFASGRAAREPQSLGHQTEELSKHASVWRFKIRVFTPLALMYAADWIQAPYLYAVYKFEKNLDESAVSALYAVGFLSAAISGLFIGALADKHGRKAMCEMYCVVYTLCCLSIFSNHVAMLIVGRIWGGLSTSLLVSVLEAWVVSEWNEKGLHDSELSLEKVLAQMSSISALMAITAGLIGEVIVFFAGTRTAPFMGSIILLFVAALMVHFTWDEHYGDNSTTNVNSKARKSGIRSLIDDTSLLSLTIVTSTFEGSLYLFVFSWTPMLRQAHKLPNALPFGIIFSSFMCAMMLGSMMFEALMALFSTSAAAGLLSTTIAVAAICLATTMLAEQEEARFLLFCSYEACIGLYYPTMGLLKANLVEAGDRARLYALIRVPLNVYVLVGLSLATDTEWYHQYVLSSCGAFLAITSILAYKGIRHDVGR